MGTRIKLAVAIGLAGLAMASFPALAEKGDWIVRGGLTMVDPDGWTGPFSDVEDVNYEVSEESTFGFSVTYMFADRWGVDFFGIVPAEHEVTIPVLPGVTPPEITGNKVEILSGKVLPPTLSLQYHFMPDGMIRPYLGAGINYTTWSSEEIIEGTLELDSSIGFAADLGVDLQFDGGWLINLDIRYLDIPVEGVQVIEGDPPYKIKGISIDPMVYSLMVGYRF